MISTVLCSLLSVRKAILASVPMSISRRSRQRGGFSSNHSLSVRGGGASNSMMKQTMKMARQRLACLSYCMHVW